MSCSIQLKYLWFICQYIKFVYFRFSVLFRFQSNKVQVFATSMNIYTPLYLLLKCTGIFLFTVVIISLILLPILITYGRLYYSRLKNKYKTNKDVLNVGFFHPYCNAGGGGERVLWCAIDCLLSKYPNIKIFVYTGDVDVSPKDILRRTHERFNIKLPDSIEFIYLHNRRWVEAEKYPRFTLLGQSFGSIVLGIEALNALVPDIFIDTMGYSFTLPIFYFIAKCRVACYVHYPTITTDMINRVRSRQVAHNNQNVVARNPLLTLLKLIYYNFFAFLYASVGKFTHVIMVNSSWTEDHINSLWKCPLRTYRIYPPCDSIDLQKIPIKQNIDGKIKIISVAQFRPEKNHPLQLQSLYKLRQIIPESIWENVELVMIGSTRDAKDELLVNDMQNLCKYLSLENNVTFKINISYDELKKELEDGKWFHYIFILVLFLYVYFS